MTNIAGGGVLMISPEKDWYGRKRGFYVCRITSLGFQGLISVIE